MGWSVWFEKAGRSLNASPNNFLGHSFSISKFEERCCFLYVLHNSDDFQIYFCTELHCRRWVTGVISKSHGLWWDRWCLHAQQGLTVSELWWKLIWESSHQCLLCESLIHSTLCTSIHWRSDVWRVKEQAQANIKNKYNYKCNYFLHTPFWD